MPNIIEGLLSEIDRVKEIIAEYEEQPNNAGALGASIMKQDIKEAKKVMAYNDTVGMMRMYEKLKELEL